MHIWKPAAAPARLALGLLLGSTAALQLPGGPQQVSAVPTPPAANAAVPPPLPSRRGAVAGGLLGAASAALSAIAPASASMEGTNWPLYLALPLAPYERRKTVLREAVAGKMWTFDQLLGTLYVHVPIRMTVVAMEQAQRVPPDRIRSRLALGAAPPPLTAALAAGVTAAVRAAARAATNASPASPAPTLLHPP